MQKTIFLFTLLVCCTFAACTKQPAYRADAPTEFKNGKITALASIAYIETDGMTLIFELGEHSDTLADYAAQKIEYAHKGTVLVGVKRQ
jgi:hypothetical protein